MKLVKIINLVHQNIKTLWISFKLLCGEYDIWNYIESDSYVGLLIWTILFTIIKTHCDSTNKKIIIYWIYTKIQVVRLMELQSDYNLQRRTSKIDKIMYWFVLLFLNYYIRINTVSFAMTILFINIYCLTKARCKIVKSK